METMISVEQLLDDREYKLDLTLLAGSAGLSREIRIQRVQRIGLALSGYLDYLSAARVSVMGQTERGYLATLDEATAYTRVEALFASELCCLVVTNGNTPPPYFLTLAEKYQTPLLSTQQATPECIDRTSDFLRDALAPRTSVHGVLVDVNGVGILIQGKSGIGKSECALELVIRGHRLVADDVVEIARVGRDTLVGRSSDLLKHLMEVRGLGIINIKDLFGVASVREQKRIEIVAELREWNPEEEYDRLGIDDTRYPILGVEIPYHILPVRPGRSMTSILEIAARNHLLKLQGHHSARAFQERLAEHLAEATTPKPFRGKAE